MKLARQRLGWVPDVREELVDGVALILDFDRVAHQRKRVLQGRERVCERERESVCVCESVCVRERVCMGETVCERDRER